MILTTIIFVLLFITYNWLMYEKYGELWSMSSGYYKLEEEDGIGELFTFFVWSIAAYLIATTYYTESVYFFVSAMGAAFTGAAAMFKSKMTAWVHYTGSAVMVGAGTAGCWAVFDYWWVLIAIIASTIVCYGLYFWKRKITNPLYWVEMAAFTFITLGISIGWLLIK